MTAAWQDELKAKAASVERTDPDVPQASPLDDAVERVRHAVDTNERAVAQLARRLGPVLRPQETEQPGRALSAEPTAQSALVAHLDRERRRLLDNAEVLDDLIARLDV